MTTLSTRPVLHYFDFAGRGECIRLAFIAANIDFEDKRYTLEEFATSAKSISPTGKLPVLELDGKLYVESLGILEYVCALSKHVPRTALETLVSSMIMHEVESTWNVLSKFMKHPSESERQEIENEMSEALQKLESTVKEHQGEKGHILKGLSFSPADLAVTGFVVNWEKMQNLLKMGELETKYPTICEVKNAVIRDNQSVKDYYGSY